MATIHLIDGGIGSVGKSLFCRVLIQYCIDRNIPYRLVEADSDNPDVAQIYPLRVEADDKGNWVSYCHQVSFTNPKPEQDPNLIFELALHQPVIVNLPAQAFHPVNQWIDRTDALRLAEQYNIRFCKWFLCNGRHDSVNLFVQSVNHFQDTVAHVLVLNHYFRRNWSHVLDRSSLSVALDRHSIAIIDFPRLPDYERDYLDERQIPFSEVRELDGLTLCQRQRLCDFLKQCYQSIDRSRTLIDR